LRSVIATNKIGPQETKIGVRHETSFSGTNAIDAA